MSSNVPSTSIKQNLVVVEPISTTTPVTKNSGDISENVAQKVHALVLPIHATLPTAVNSNRDIIAELDALLSTISNPDLRTKLEYQCFLIQSEYSKENISQIPSQIVILLIQREWKRFTKASENQAAGILSNLAETVIHDLKQALFIPNKLEASSTNYGVKQITPSWLTYSINYTSGDGVLRLDTVENIYDLRHDILSILRNNNYIQKIEFSPDAPSQFKRFLMEILSENRPLLGVLRIVPEWRVGTYLIRGAKKINDTLSQQTADQIFGNIKAHLIETINNRYWHGKAIRITTSFNKLIIALPRENNISLPSQEEIDELVRNAIVEKHELIEASLDKFQKTRFEIQQALNEIQVTCGESQVAQIGGELAKLEAVYESEIRARWGVAGKESIQRMREIRELEAQFVNEFQNTRFRHGKYTYPATILDTYKELRPHPLLIEIVRKSSGVDLIEPERLGTQIYRYIDALNRELDYIAPAVDFRADIQEARIIDKNFRNGLISRRAFETTYKNTLSKAAFYGEIEGKKGVCVMIDIKGMFLKNCNAYTRLSEKIVKEGENVPILARLDVLGNITRGFIRGTEEIDGYYPNILSTHGGDEFMFFIEHATEDKIADILKHARESLGNEGFDIRASARVSIGSKEIFNALDGETKIAKVIEVIGRLSNGSTPAYLRHIEVSAESFSPDYIVSELQRRRRFVESSILELGNNDIKYASIELRGLKVQIEKTSENSIKIQTLPLE